MDRRKVLQSFLAQASTLAGVLACSACARVGASLNSWLDQSPPPEPRRAARALSRQGKLALNASEKGEGEAGLHEDLALGLAPGSEAALAPLESSRDCQKLVSPESSYKMRYFDQAHPGDVFIAREKRSLLVGCEAKLAAVQAFVGYGHFNLLGLDELVKICKHAPQLVALSRAELDFFEEIFYFDAVKYGFYGKKLISTLTYAIAPQEVVKIPGSGHYLYKRSSLPLYQRIVKDIGDSIILTSGVRGIMKQMHLFLAKTLIAKGNLSQASRSLAPPGHSYHALGDFDIGKKGWGDSNFTDRFSQTEEYKKLVALGYIDIRYPSDNPYGVRFEPWHIEGVSRFST